MKENRKLLKEVLKDIRHDMTDEEVLNLLADSKISVSPESEKEKYTLGQRAADSIAKFAGIAVAASIAAHMRDKFFFFILKISFSAFLLFYYIIKILASIVEFFQK